MIRTFEERWNVEYLSGVTNERSYRISIRSQYTGSYVKEPKFQNLLLFVKSVELSQTPIWPPTVERMLYTMVISLSVESDWSMI